MMRAIAVHKKSWPAPLVLAASLFFGACGGGGSDDSGGGTAPPAPQPVVADLTLLFMGNSHASVNHLPFLVRDMIVALRPGKTVAAVEAPGWMFLEERFHDSASTSLLRNQNWSFVILQAQKYSSSGQFEYSTAGAEGLIRMSRGQQAVPVMFPEWPRLNVNETARIYDLHVSIAQREVACVAPIGQAWDLALQRHPSLRLHADDGNHSNPAGAYLAALIIVATITGSSPLDVPPMPQFVVDVDTQALLRPIAAETVQVWPPHAWCPSDPYA
jgi:hypothetical protein